MSPAFAVSFGITSGLGTAGALVVSDGHDSGAGSPRAACGLSYSGRFDAVDDRLSLGARCPSPTAYTLQHRRRGRFWLSCIKRWLGRVLEIELNRFRRFPVEHLGNACQGHIDARRDAAAGEEVSVPDHPRLDRLGADFQNLHRNKRSRFWKSAP